MPKNYVVNRVTCDQTRTAKVCRSLPWYPPTLCQCRHCSRSSRSQCALGSGQECRMVEKTRCVPVCNKSPMCNRYLTPTIASSSAVQV